MSSYDKVVKLACKPKAAPPKAKYLDPIIAATWSEDGAVHDVCKALSPRFREPNAIVVFKALIVLHTMIRNGATDNVLSYLSSSEVLRLRNVSTGNWEGYSAPQNLQNYAIYLDARIRAYHDLKHDAIRVQAENNRDTRNNNSIEDEHGSFRNKKSKHTPPPLASSAPTRSKTLIGRKLRSMTVEKGLLRETKTVHKMIDTLVECRFYLDDLEDELTTTALRMLVKDLLILFQAGNEGVINLLEHYFEMSHVDAEQALSIYRNFCKQTERVVEYLGVAKKLQNILNVSIPNLKHAPVSLANALQEYLDDPNFEQNRIEYRTNKDALDSGLKKGAVSKNASKPTTPQPPAQTLASTSASAGAGSTTTGKSDDILDFFSSIEEVQPTMFNPQTNSPNSVYFQTQQNVPNPFHMMVTGQSQVQMQPTGYVMPQQMGMQPASNPFGAYQQQLQPQPTGHRPFSSYLPQQTTGLMPMSQSNGYLQPQATGGNPFRQSVLMPQTTGMAMFGVGGGANSAPPTSMASQSTGFMAQQNFGQINPSGSQSAGILGQPNPATSSGPIVPTPSFSINGNAFRQSTQSPPAHIPPRPASTPLTSFTSSSSPSSTSPPIAQPVKSHQTGTRNPFGPVMVPAPPVPKVPTLMELAMGHVSQNASQQQQQQQQQPQSQLTTDGFSFSNSILNPGPTDMSSIASSFNNMNMNGTQPTSPNSNGASLFIPANSLFQNTAATTTGSTTSESLFSSISSQPTGMTAASTNSAFTPVKSHMTGFSGLKPFKPSSSFGASLLETIPASSPITPAATGNPISPSSDMSRPSNFNNSLFPSATGLPGGQNQLQNGNQRVSALGTGLRPQMTGGGFSNPFRASMMDPNSSGPNLPSNAQSSFGGINGSSPSFQPTGGNMFGAGTGTIVPFGVNQTQPQANASFI